MRIVKKGTRYLLVNDQNIAVTNSVTKEGCLNVLRNFVQFAKNGKTEGYIDTLVENCSQQCADMLYACIDEFKYDDVVSGNDMKEILRKQNPEVYKVDFKYSHEPYETERPAFYKVYVCGLGFFGTITVTLHSPVEGDNDDFFVTSSHEIKKYVTVRKD